MPCNELKELRDRVHDLLGGCEDTLPTPAIARHLFGARRHELPETQVVVRTLLAEDSRFIETHDGRWTVRGGAAVNRRLDRVTFAVVDLETTGSVIGVDETIEIGLVRLQGTVEIQRVSSLVWTRRHIPPWVARLTGIRKRMLIRAPRFEELAPTLFELLDGAVFVAHDIRFDLPFLRWEFVRRGLAAPNVTGLCTLRLAQTLWPELGGWSLNGLAETFGFAHDRPHRALADAGAAAGLLRLILSETDQLGLHRLEDLYLLESRAFATDDELAARAAES
jgi:DNA polymerase III epsilon subunit family exonuclease